MRKLSVITITIGILALLQSCAPDLSAYQHLKEPQISTKPGQTMLVVKIQGDPAITGKNAFPALFKTYYKLDKEIRGAMGIPRARWPEPFDSPRSQWLGIYGLPVSASVETLPERDNESDPEVNIEYWEYGEVAEILHAGPYGAETPTIENLYNFIAERGYRIAGPHEEEYLKGPGIFSKGNPKKYQTIIRYVVEKE